MDGVILVLVSLHLLAAVFLVGGSLFIWLVAVPASRDLGVDEAKRTAIVGQIAKRFGRFVHPSLAVLIGTGIPLAFEDVGSLEALTGTPRGRVLLVKIGLVLVFLILMYLHNVVYGRQITEIAARGRLDELQRLRRKSRPVAYTNLVLLVGIVLLGVLEAHMA